MTVRVAVRSLRTQTVFGVVCRAIREVNRERAEEFRIVEFSVQSNHVHLIVEAERNEALSSGMQSLMLRWVRRINASLGRKGSLFTDRFHDRELTSARQVKLVLAYVFANFRKHGAPEARAGCSLDPFSSAPFFDGFAAADFTSVFQTLSSRDGPAADPPVVKRRSRWLSGAWKREGLLSIGYWPPQRNTDSIGQNRA